MKEGELQVQGSFTIQCEQYVQDSLHTRIPTPPFLSHQGTNRLCTLLESQSHDIMAEVNAEVKMQEKNEK